MSTLTVLQNSLAKKEADLERRFNQYFDSVGQANGQPLNDKRSGAATMARWDRQSDGIRRQLAEVEKTKAAIEREKGKIGLCAVWYGLMPDYLQSRIDSGALVQWRKHPNTLFVPGVEKARLVFDDKDGLVGHRYVREIPTPEQYALFRAAFNEINELQRQRNSAECNP